MKDDIFRFDISMYYLQGMDLVDSITDLPHDEGYSRL